MEIALGISKDKLKKKIEELEEKTKAWEKEKKKLVQDFKAKWAPAEDEAEDLKILESRAEFVTKIDALNADCRDMGKACFLVALKQLMLMNPDLNVIGTGLKLQIVDE